MPPEEGADAKRTEAGSSDSPSLSISGDWAAQLTQKIEEIVGLVRDRTVRPVESAVRYVIVGIAAFVIVIVALVLFAIVVIRVLDNEVPFLQDRVWATYLIVAGIFWIAGLLLSRMRHPRD